MKLSEYFVLAVAVASVVVAQESNSGSADKKNKKLVSDTIEVIKYSTKENLDANVFPNATLILEEALYSFTYNFSKSEDIINDGISKAKQLILDNPEAAKKLLQKAFVDAQTVMFQYSSPSMLSYGAAYTLSNEESKQGLDAAIKSAQIAGLSVINSLFATEDLLIGGISAGSNAALELLDAGLLAVQTGYATAYRNIQMSIRKADKALRDAQSNPMQEPAENPDCESAQDDDDASNAIADINEASNKSLQRGANAAIVQKFAHVLKCGVIRVSKLLNKAIDEANNLTTPAENDPFTTKITYFKLVDLVEERLSDVTAKGYLALGEAGFKSDNQSNIQMEAAVAALATGQVQVVMALHSAKALVSITTGHPGDSPALTLAATAKIGSYIKLSLIQALVKTANIVLNVL